MMDWESERWMAADVEENPDLYIALADEDSEQLEVEEFTFERATDVEREGIGVEDIQHEFEMTLETDALDDLLGELAEQRFQAEARAALVLLGLLKCGMSIDQYLRRWENAERRRTRCTDVPHRQP